MNIQVASIQISQDYVVEKARQLVLSEKLYEARNLLKSLDNITEDNIVDLLSGKAILRNNNMIYSVEMNEEEKEEIEAYLEDLNYLNTGKIKKNDGWYQPYAVIEYFHVNKFYTVIKKEFEDLKNLMEARILLHNLSGAKHFPLVTIIAKCSKVYAEKIAEQYGNTGDKIEFVSFDRKELKYIKNGTGYGHVVVFKKTSEYPYFMQKPAQTPKEAVLQVLRNDNSLEDIGSTYLEDPKSLYWDEDLPNSNSILQEEPKKHIPDTLQDKKSWNIYNYQIQIKEFDKDWPENKLSEMRHKIREQAQKDGFIDIQWINQDNQEKTISVPKAPFLRWAFESKSLKHQISSQNIHHIEWENVCPESFRIDGDIPDHSDWLLGAIPDIHPMKWYDPSYEEKSEFQEAAYNKALEIINQMNKKSYDGQILTGGKNVKGYAWHPTDSEMPPNAILILKDLNPKYYGLMMKCQNEGTGVIISEAGGQMAHLTNVARENNITLLRMSNARKTLPSQKEISIKIEEKGFYLI